MQPSARGRVQLRSDVEKSESTETGGLEASLLQLVEDHHNISLRLREQSEKAKREGRRNAGRVGDLLVEAVNGGVQDSFINEKRIEAEIRGLAVAIAKFMKQTHHWLSTTQAMNTAIKEIGDFENWMRIMEFDCRSINAAIRNIHQE